MLRKAIAGCSLLALSLCANADLIVSQSSITGADMAGIEVSVTFASGATETAVMQVFSNTPLNTGDPIIDMNGFSGLALGQGWELVQSGLTLGGFDDANPANAYGLWELINISAPNITKFSINGFTGSAMIAFDIDPDAVGFPGSETGQLFVSNTGDTAVYSSQVDVAFSDLFWQLDVELINPLEMNQQVDFFADTDAMAVSTPATLGLLFGGLVLAARRKASLAIK